MVLGILVFVLLLAIVVLILGVPVRIVCTPVPNSFLTAPPQVGDALPHPVDAVSDFRFPGFLQIPILVFELVLFLLRGLLDTTLDRLHLPEIVTVSVTSSKRL